MSQPKDERVGAKIAVIGGGTGSFTLLSSLKHYTRHITALVNMADDGGSTGMLRDELGVLPPGDVRQCLVALSESEKVRDLFNYRFNEGSLKGHAFGNLFLTALEKMTGNFAEAVETAGEVLHITGAVHPITLNPVTLVMEGKNGKVTNGEFEIGHANFGSNKRPNMKVIPAARINPEARAAILEADLVVIAPGNIYGSLAPALVLPGVSEALEESNAKKIYVCNLATKPGQTDGFSVADFADEIERLANTQLDYVIYNNQKPTKELLEKYAKENEYWVEAREDEFKKRQYKAVGGAFIGSQGQNQPSLADPIGSTRTLMRHDADAVARQLMRIYFA